MGEMTRTTVTAVTQLSRTIKAITLISADGGLLPEFSAGAHVVATARVAERSHSCPFSLACSPFERWRWRVVVKRCPAGQRQDGHLFECVHLGQQLETSRPRNGFPLADGASRHVFLAAGIGITPFLAHLHEVEERGEDFELHHVYRHEADGVLSDELVGRYGNRVRQYVSAFDQRLLPERVLAARPRGAHLYLCGAIGFVEASAAAAMQHGWPETAVHWEQHLRLRNLPAYSDGISNAVAPARVASLSGV